MLDWEEWLFRGGLHLWKMVRPAPEKIREEAVKLEDHRIALTTLARILSQDALRLVPAQEQGGLRAHELLIPPILDISASFEENYLAMVVRVAIQATSRRLNLDRHLSTDPRTRALQSVSAGRTATLALIKEFPNFEVLYQRILPAALASRARLSTHPAWEAWIADATAVNLAWEGTGYVGPTGPPLILWGELIPAPLDVVDPNSLGEENRLPSQGTERKGKAADHVERAKLNEKKADNNVLQHVFEKVETLDEHQGQNQRIDGSDELDEHLEALDELNMRQILRGGEQARSLYRAEVGIEANIPDIEGQEGRGLLYPEWDGSRYKPDWCTVVPTPLGAGDPIWAAQVLPGYRKQIEELYRRMLVHNTRRRPQSRQTEGPSIDLEAVIEDRAACQAGQTPTDRLYMRPARHSRSLATTVLLDISLSSDAWVAEKRVLDIAREAVLVLGEVTEKLGDSLQVLAFSSHTRNQCRVWSVRDWNEPWKIGKSRLGVLHPQGYTRMGPALRHAVAGLCRVDADKKLLLLVSDGKVTDFDRYEGRYGMSDVRQALREARARGVFTHALAVDATARDYLPTMFGPGAYQILPNPQRLPDALASLYGRWHGACNG